MALSFLQILLLAGAFQGACLSWLLLSHKNNRLANQLLGILIMILSFQVVLVAFDNRDFFMRFPHLSKVSWLLPSLFGPLIFLFTQKLTSQHARLRKRDMLHLLPFLVYFLLLSPYYLQSAESKRLYLDNFVLASVDDFGLLNQVTNGIHLAYTFMAILLIRRHERRIQDLFSDISRIRLDWLKTFIGLAAVIIVFGITVFYARKWDVPGLSELYHFHYLGVIVIIYWIGYKALSQPSIFRHDALIPSNTLLTHSQLASSPAEPVLPQRETKYQKSGLSAQESEEVLQQTLAFMKSDKPYLNNTLSLQDLADQLQLPKHHISQVINDRLGQNFFTFVNTYRVEEAQRLLVDQRYQHFNTLAVAMEAGFNSKATFNTAFKKHCGMTPSAYVNAEKKRSELVGKDDLQLRTS